jgi:hypothetical protein
MQLATYVLHVQTYTYDIKPIKDNSWFYLT